MVRRDFIRKLSVAGGAASIAQAGEKPAAAKRAVTYQVKGFTCITCAVGLEVVLKGFRGVAEAKATYPEGKVVVGFDPALTSEETIRAFINKATGFTVVEVKA